MTSSSRRAIASRGTSAAEDTSRWARLGRLDFGLIGALFLVFVLAAGFGLLAEEVMEGDTARFDLATITAMRTPGDLADPLGPPWVEEMGRDVTALGSYSFLGFVLVAAVIYLVLIRKRGLAWLMAACVLGGMALSTLLKYGIDRPRPDFPHTARVFTPGFPSGHATLSTIVFLTLGALLARAEPDPRIKTFLVGVAVFLTVMVGLSRMYLGVHYPSDVIAGWCIGSAWALLCWTVALWLQRRGQVEGRVENPAP